MPSVFFQKERKSIEIEAGRTVLETARKADVEIDSPCGGNGTCGKCLVKVTGGGVDFDNQGAVSQQAYREGWVLACRAKVIDRDVTLYVPEQESRDGGRFADHDEDAAGSTVALPEGEKPDPEVFSYVCTVDPPEQAPEFPDMQRLAQALEKKCGKAAVIPSLQVLRNASDVLRRESGRVTATLRCEKDTVHVLDIKAGAKSQNLGIAVDIGTTTVALQLVDLTTGRILASWNDYNSQVRCGLDVISRINYARTGEKLGELKKRVLRTINGLLAKAAEEASVMPGDITSCVVSGNTTMNHLFLGLAPEYIRLEPYVPAFFRAPVLRGSETGLGIHPGGAVFVSPNVGSYVGGDITAGLVSTGDAFLKDDISLYIDIGTNGELVIGNKDFLLSCACSAGPAFEGGGIGCGMRAASGAVEDVKVDPADGRAEYSIIGEGRPRGVCGSGLINTTAELFRTGLLDQAGRLDCERGCEWIRREGSRAFYTIVPAGETETGKPIEFSETDIESLLRAKAAVYSAISLLLEQTGLESTAIGRIIIAGGFGRFIDLKNAVTIGLVPDLPLDRFEFAGNASLAGSAQVLLSKKQMQKQRDFAHRMTYIDLGTDPAYMNQYTAALFLPHTEKDLFPSVKQGK